MLKKWQRGGRSQNPPTQNPRGENSETPARTYYPQNFQRQVLWDPKHEHSGGNQGLGSISSFTPGEWTSPPKILQVAQALSALANAKDLPGNVVVIREEAQLQELKDMWAATSSKIPLTVVFDGSPEIQNDGTKVKISIKRGRTLIPKLETVTAWRLGDESKCAWISQAKKTDFTKFTPTPKVTVRFTAPQHFRLAFTDGFGDQKPIDIIKEIANWHVVASTAQLMGGSWKWEQGKKSDQLVGHLKLPQEVATKCEKLSGQRGIFCTQTPVPYRDETISWQARMENEDNDNYHRRILALARERRQGVKYRSGGGKDLGVKRLPSDQIQTRQTLVSILGVPPDWDCQDLSSFLEAQKWTDLEIIQKKPLNRRCVRWLVKGFPPDSSQGPWKYSGLEDADDTFIHISKMETRKPVGTKQTWYVEPPKRANKFEDWFHQKSHTETNEETQETAITQLDDDEDDATTGEKRERSPRRKTQGQVDRTTGKDPPKSSKTLNEDIIREFISRGWERKNVGGTGDCGWRSLAAAIAWNQDEVLDESLATSRGALLKTQAISYMRKHRDDFAPFLKKDKDSSPSEKPEKPEDVNKRVDAFLAEAALPQTWICGATLLAAAKKQGIPIIIWYRTKETEAWTRCCLAPAWKDGKPKCASNEKPVTLVLEEQHYTWLAKPKSQNIPDAWLRESSIPEPKVLRGAAKTEASSSSQTPSIHTMPSLRSSRTPSVHTMRSHIHTCQSRVFSAGKTAPKPSEPDVSQEERSQPQTVRRRIQGKQSCPTLHTMDIDLDIDSCGLDEPAEVSFSDPTTLRPAGKPPLKDSRPCRQNRLSTIDWTCPICKVNMTLTGHDKAYGARKRHLQIAHRKEVSEVGPPTKEKISLAHKKGINHLKTTCIQKAFMRKKQVETEHDHLLFHCTLNGLFKVFQKTWFCSKCLMRGSAREMAEKTCSRQHWNRTQAKWWIRTPEAYKQKIKVVCNWSEATFQSIQDIAKEIWEKSTPIKTVQPGPQTKERWRKIGIQKKAWRQRQNLPEKGTGGKSSGRTAVTELVKRTYYKDRKPNKYQKTIKQRLDDNRPENCGPGKWQHDLTEEGVEPHPGPSHHKNRKQTNFTDLSIWQLNIDSWKLRGWKLLKEAEKANIDILCLQEMKIQQSEAEALKFSLRNWQMFYQAESESNKSNGREGGVAVFVKKTSQQSKLRPFSRKAVSGFE